MARGKVIAEQKKVILFNHVLLFCFLILKAPKKFCGKYFHSWISKIYYLVKRSALHGDLL